MAIDEYIKEKGYKIKSLVAFSGTVSDDDVDYTEEGMNGIKGGELPETFDKNDDIKILIVAEKYQTGFDQPKLCAMYVDKMLDGVKAVQTLSRLNRTTVGKDNTFILDFYNSTEDIVNSFAPYYEQTNIDQNTDPNLVFDMYYKMDAIHIYTPEEVNDFASLYLKEKQSNRDVEKMNNLIDRAVERFEKHEEEEQEEFRVMAIKYLRAYNFIIQIYPLKNSNLFKLYLYLSGLVKKLPKFDNGGKLHLDDLLSLDYYKTKQIAEEFKNIDDLKDRANSNSFEDFKNSFAKNNFMRGLIKRKAVNQNIFDKVINEPTFKDFIINEIAMEVYNEFN